MRSLILALVASLVVACTPATVATAPSQPTAIADTVVMSGQDALSRAADAYAGAAAIATAAVNHGAFSADQLRMIRTLSNQALALLEGSDATLTQAQRAASVFVIIGQLKSIIGK